MNNSLSHKDLSSPLRASISWKNHNKKSPITISLSAFELEQDKEQVYSLDNIVFLGSSLDDEGKASSKDQSIKLDILDIEDNCGESGISRMLIYLDKIPDKIYRIRITASILAWGDSDPIPFSSFNDCTFTLEDTSGDRNEYNINKLATNNLCTAIDLGIVARHESGWRFEDELISHPGEFRAVYEEYASETLREQEPYIERICIARLKKNIKLYTKEFKNGLDFTKKPITKINHRPNNIRTGSTKNETTINAVPTTSDVKTNSSYQQNNSSVLVNNEGPDAKELSSSVQVQTGIPQKSQKKFKTQATKAINSHKEHIKEISTTDNSISKPQNDAITLSRHQEKSFKARVKEMHHKEIEKDTENYQSTTPPAKNNTNKNKFPKIKR